MGMVAAVLALLALARLPLASAALPLFGLRGQVTALGPTEIEITNVSGPNLAAERLVVGYGPLDILSGQVRQIRLERPLLRLDPFAPAAAGSALPPHWRLDRLEVTDGRILVPISADADGPEALLRWGGELDWAAQTGSLGAEMSPADLGPHLKGVRLSLTAVPDGVGISLALQGGLEMAGHPALLARGVTGKASLRLQPSAGGLTWQSADPLALTVKEVLNRAGTLLQNIQLTLGGSGQWSQAGATGNLAAEVASAPALAGMMLENWRLTAVLEPDGRLGAAAKGSVQLAQWGSDARLHADLTLTGGDFSQGAGATLAGSVSDPGAKLKAAVNGRLVPQPWRLVAQLTLPETDLAGLSPFGGFLAGLDRGEGTFSAAADITAGAEGVETALRFRLAEIGLNAGSFAVAGLSGSGNLTSLAPLQSAQPITLTIRRISAGVDITGLSATVELPDGKSFSLVQAGGMIAGGIVQIPPFSGALAPLSGQSMVLADGLDLATLLAPVAPEDLSAEGTLSGTLPFSLSPQGLAISGGVLESSAPGRIAYRGAGGQSAFQNAGQGGAIASKVLENFLYDKLRVRIERPPGGTTGAALDLIGRNPALYNGYPVEMTVNLLGPLEQIASDGLRGFQVPETLRQRYSPAGQPAAPPGKGNP